MSAIEFLKCVGQTINFTKLQGYNPATEVLSQGPCGVTKGHCKHLADIFTCIVQPDQYVGHRIS